MNVDKAKAIVKSVAASRKRWGLLTDGFGEYQQSDFMDAMVLIHDEGFLESDTEAFNQMKADLTKANRQAGAANARATKFSKQCEDLNERIKELVVALEESELMVAALTATDGEEGA